MARELILTTANGVAVYRVAGTDPDHPACYLLYAGGHTGSNDASNYFALGPEQWRELRAYMRSDRSPTCVHDDGPN
jgi:hypothetical protein